MMSGLFGLPWLLPAPSDFKARARAALTAPSLDQGEVRKLGSYALDLSHLETMKKVVRRHGSDLVRQAGLTPFRLGIASSHTMDYVAMALPGTALRHNLVLDVWLTESGEDPQRLLGSDSEFGRAALDAVLVALDYRVLGLGETQLTPQEAEIAVGCAIDYVTEFAAGVRAMGTTCILQTLVPPVSPVFGSLDGRVPGSVRAMVAQFNERLVDGVAQEDDLVLDAAFLASVVGLSAWNHARDWNKVKLPGALDSTPLYADHICRLLGAKRGRTRKCVVMDLDDTLWGGAIGNDGLAGIRLGHGSSVGEAHVALQRYLLELRKRGVMLAVCSRDAEVNARLPFRSHPEMVLKEDHIAGFFSNWSDKARNLREIAAKLNIGIDQVVYLDDNPAERARVREVLPEVAVPELTADPADFAGLLSAAGYFETVSFSMEDLNRANLDKARPWSNGIQRTGLNRRRESSELVATVSPFNAACRTRVTQLINAADPFNLTDKRYSEADIEQLQAAADKFCRQVSLADRFGDNDITSVLVFDRAAEEWRCHIWLMSGWASGTRVEELALATVAQAASAAGASRLVGVSLPASRNVLSSDHFAKLGFTRVSDLPGGGTKWSLDLASYRMPALPFAVVRPN
jgi:FkbH-like protein